MYSIQILPQDFSIAKVADASAVDWDAPFVFVGKTDREFSLVCPSGALAAALEREDGWRGMRIDGTLDFSLTGVLAPIATLLAEQKIGIFAVSTYDTDYLFVKAGALEQAAEALRGAGYAVE